MNKHIRPILIALVLIASVLIGGCLRTGQNQSPDVTGEPKDGIQALFDQAEGYYRNNKFDKALERYVNIIETAPDSDYAAPSLYKIGGIHMKKKNFEKR